MASNSAGDMKNGSSYVWKWTTDSEVLLGSISERGAEEFIAVRTVHEVRSNSAVFRLDEKGWSPENGEQKEENKDHPAKDHERIASSKCHQRGGRSLFSER